MTPGVRAVILHGGDECAVAVELRVLHGLPGHGPDPRQVRHPPQGPRQGPRPRRLGATGPICITSMNSILLYK